MRVCFRQVAPSPVLLKEPGLGPPSVALLRHAQSLEADQGFRGALSSDASAAAVDAIPRAVKSK